MKPYQVFGIIVRALGLFLLVYSIWHLVYALATVLGLPEQQPGYGVGYLIDGIAFFLISIYLLRGAPHILRFSYPDETKSDRQPKLEIKPP